MIAAFFRLFFEHPSWPPADGIGARPCQERSGAATSSRCLFSGCVLCPPGSKRKWERISSQSVWKMTHWVIFCISNRTLAFLPIYWYSQALCPKASLMDSCIPRNVSLSVFTHFFILCIFKNFFTFIFSETGIERPKLQPTQCDSCKNNIPKVWQATSFLTTILPISGFIETGHKGSGVLGSPWPVWGGKSSSAQVCSYTERGQMSDKNHATGAWEEDIFAPFPCLLIIPHQTQLSFGREEGNGLRSGRAELRLLLLGKMQMQSSQQRNGVDTPMENFTIKAADLRDHFVLRKWNLNADLIVTGTHINNLFMGKL